MADTTTTNLPPVTISGLPQANQANVTDQLEANQFGTSRSVTVGQIVALAASPASSMGLLPPGTVYATQFNAKFDGVTDDTTALKLFLAAIPTNGIGVMPPGTAIFKDTLLLQGNSKTLIGAGAHTTVLKYTGPSTNIDLIYMRADQPGGLDVAVQMWHLANFLITTDTTMTAGAALHLENVINTVLYSVIIDGHVGSKRPTPNDPTGFKHSKLWNGAWFDCVGTVHVYDMTAKAYNDCIIVNGGLNGTNRAQADIMFTSGRILHGQVGLHIAGGFGGISTIGVSMQQNTINCVIDNSITAEVNREIMFGSNTWFDRNYDVSILINDITTGNTGFIQFDNCWMGGALSDPLHDPAVPLRGFGMLIMPGVGHSILITGGRMWLNEKSGIRNESADATVMIRGTQIMSNGSVADSAKTITGITQANPGVVTVAAHGYRNGDTVAIAGVVGMTQVNGFQFTVANVAANTFQLLNVDTTAYTAYGSAGTTTRVSFGIESVPVGANAVPATAGSVTVSDCFFFGNGASAVFNYNNNVPNITEHGSPAQFRVRDNVRVIGPGQAVATFNTAGSLGGSVTLQDSLNNASSGGALIFAAGSGNFAAIKGLLQSAANNTQGNVVVSTRRATADATLTETIRFTSAGATITAGILSTAVSSTTEAGLRINPGVAPTTPVNGDIWTTATGLFVRINGVTKTVTLT